MILFYSLAVGFGSLGYYMLMRIYTGKWDSTFAGFWLLCGGAHLVCAACLPYMPQTVYIALKVFLALGWCLLATVLGKILWTAGKQAPEHAAYLIVLGAQVRGTRITNSLMRRLDTAYGYLLKNPETRVIVSGGQGKGEEITEAEAMAENLIGRGIETERVLLEDKSVSTQENLRFCARMIHQGGSIACPVVVVSNSFHVYRALLLGKYEGYLCLSGLSATSNPVLLPNYLMREFFAVLLTKVRAVR